MTLGSHFMDGFVPDVDATVVTRLLEAGGDIVGKLNMDGFSSGGHGLGTGLGDYGPSLNPSDKDRVSGGSSSGSAVAVAAGLVDLALGVDQGGSVRGPAAWCGVAGLKPTFGLLPCTGVVGADDLLDHVGPITRRARDLREPLEVMAGPDWHDLRCAGAVNDAPSGPPRHGPRGLRIGVVAEAFGDPEADPDVEAAVREAISSFERSGALVAPVSLPIHSECARLMATLLTLGMYSRVMNGGAGRGACPAQPELPEAIGARLAAGRGGLLPARTKLAILIGECLGPDAGATYVRARWAATNYRRAYQLVFDEHDLLAMPTVPIRAPSPDSGPGTALSKTLRRRYARVSTVNTAAANVTGNPAITVPCGPADELPIGLQLVGPWYADRLLIDTATWFEESRAG
jgi:amidase